MKPPKKRLVLFDIDGTLLRGGPFWKESFLLSFGEHLPNVEFPKVSFGGKTKGGNSNSGFSVGPFIRYYFLKTEKNINFLVEANYYYGKDFNKSDFVTNYGFKAGPVIYFNSSVGLELLAKYEHVFYSSDSFTTNSFQIGLGLQIHLEK